MTLPRPLHPVAWWIWALAMAAAASSTTNPLLLVLIVTVVGLVVLARRSEAPWARAIRYYLWLALVVIIIRVLFRIVFATGVAESDHIIFTLPLLSTPDWYSGIQIGGPVSLEAVLSAVFDGMRLACLLCCLGAANTLANPKRALRVLPGALYELGVAVTVALSVAPQLVESVQRVSRARRLRAGRSRGLQALRAIAIPVLHDAFDRSLALAASMDSRGYGRTGSATRGSRRVTAALMMTGMAGLCLGIYALLDASVPSGAAVGGFAAGGVLCVGGLALGGRRVSRSRYRPDPWRWPETVVAACGIVTAIVIIGGVGFDATLLHAAVRPLQWPTLSPIPVLAVLLGGLPAFVAPPPAPKAVP